MITKEDEMYWELFKVSVENVDFKNLELGKIYAIKIHNRKQVLTLPNTITMVDDEFLGLYTGHFKVMNLSYLIFGSILHWILILAEI